MSYYELNPVHIEKPIWKKDIRKHSSIIVVTVIVIIVIIIDIVIYRMI